MTTRNIFAGIALAALLTAAPSHASRSIPDLPALVASSSRDASLDDYRKHLQDLAALVESCAKARDTISCDPALVGPDDRVPLTANAERRMVRYGWLRVLLVKAQEKDKATGKPEAKPAAGEQSDEGALPPPPTTTELLKAAETRLAEDLTQTNSATIPATDHAQQRETMKQVLAGREFRNLYEPTVKNTLLEKLGNWLNKLFERAAQFRARSAWVGFVIYWGFILAVCVGLVWGLLQLERRWRDAAVPGERRIRWSRLGARVAAVAQGCAQCRRCGPMARGDSFPLLGVDFAAGIAAAVAGRPRPHSARVSCAGGA